MLPPPVLLVHLTLKPGDVYSDAVRDADYKALQKLYEDKLHLELGNFEGGIVPSSINLQAGTADVKYDVYVARIAVVEVTGNTRTKDQVIRRELRERPGMVLNTDAIKRDYERLNALNYFSKVEPDIKPGPDPKKPQDVTLVWHVTEQRTATASIGFGYSGGLTGLGLYATLGFSDNNLHGTGNSAGIQFEEGARAGIAQLNVSIPYLSNTPQGQKYTAGAQIFSNHETYYYPIYAITGSGVSVKSNVPVPIPVTLYSGTNSSLVSGRRRNERLQRKRRERQYRTTPERLHDSFAFTQRPAHQATTRRYHRHTTSKGISRTFSSGRRRARSARAHTTMAAPSASRRPRSLTSIPGAPYNLVQSGLELADDYARRSVQSANRHQGAPQHDVLGAGDRIELLLHRDDARYREVLPDLARRDARRARRGVQLDGRHSAELALYVLRSADARLQSGLLRDQRRFSVRSSCVSLLALDRRLTLAVFVDELDYHIRGAYPLLDPYTNRVTGYPARLGALRRRRLRHPIRRTAAWPAHGAHRLCKRASTVRTRASESAKVSRKRTVSRIVTL